MSLNDLANKHGTDKGDGHFEKHGYASVYEQLIDAISGRGGSDFTLLEIGVFDPRFPGASMRMWREFLPTAKLHGVDINPRATSLEDCQIHVLDQGDPQALRTLMARVGPVDFVCDDGSHRIDHIKTTFAALWPFVRPGGVYVIEDLHAAQAKPTEEILRHVQSAGATPALMAGGKLCVVRR
jgi:8-demethyl-8-alpha-L-rhamnosyltetracenomycin-C 2'-O-methyltransferase